MLNPSSPKKVDRGKAGCLVVGAQVVEEEEEEEMEFDLFGWAVRTSRSHPRFDQWIPQGKADRKKMSKWCTQLKADFLCYFHKFV